MAMLETDKNIEKHYTSDWQRWQIKISIHYNTFMTHEANDVLRRALALPPEDRAELAGSLLESLDAAADADTEEAWQQEVARRIQDLDAGKAQTIPWTEVRRRIAAKLENGR